MWKFLKNINIELPYDPAIPLLGIYLKKIKTLTQKDTCIPMFIAALFTIVKLWKQLKCLSTDEWIKKMLCIHIHINTCAHTHIQSGIVVSNNKEGNLAICDNMDGPGRYYAK